MNAAAKILSETNLGVPAAGFFSDARQARIGQIGHQHRLEAARTDAWLHGTGASAAHTHSENHHVLTAGAIDDLRLADRTLTKTDRAGVLAVAEHQNHRTLVFLVLGALERIQRLVDATPERRRRIRRNRRRQFCAKLADVVRERRADRDVVAERTDSRDIVASETCEELRAGIA